MTGAGLVEATLKLGVVAKKHHIVAAFEVLDHRVAELSLLLRNRELQRPLATMTVLRLIGEADMGLVEDIRPLPKVTGTTVTGTTRATA